MMSPPLRFLTLVIGGWVLVRGALLGSAWWAESPTVLTPAAPVLALAQAEPEKSLAPSVIPPWLPAVDAGQIPGNKRRNAAMFPRQSGRVPREALAFRPEPVAMPVQAQPTHRLPTTIPAQAELAAMVPQAFMPPPRQKASRWSGSAWLFLRDGGSQGLAPGGTLGGSQAGGRIGYRLNSDASRPLALSARAYAPIDAPEGGEVAAGVDWKPVAALPVHVLVERRQAVGSQGRSAFAATVYGGVSDLPAGPLRIDAYGQGGVVGMRSRDMFADGSARISVPVGRLKAGAGIWAAAQPGVSRVDVGPQVSVRLAPNLSLAADWRFRVAGEAAPASGPALTIAADF